MIYFCKGCECIGKGCDECSKALGECCKPCAKILERPLGGFVLMSIIVNLIVLICALLGVINPDVKNCTDPVMLLCLADAVLAIIHGGFGVYLQSRLVSGLTKAGAIGPSSSLPSSEIMKQAGHIALYDVGFCLYIFVFAGSFFLQRRGLDVDR